MAKTVKIKDLIGQDVRSRSNEEIVKSVVDGEANKVILDFSGVTFISRAFADELLNILYEFKDAELSNMNQTVKSMINAVKAGRAWKRLRREDKSEINTFNDMDSLSSFLSTM